MGSVEQHACCSEYHSIGSIRAHGNSVSLWQSMVSACEMWWHEGVTWAAGAKEARWAAGKGNCSCRAGEAHYDAKMSGSKQQQLSDSW